MYVELLKPLPSSATVTTDLEVVDVMDKGSGAVLIYDSKLLWLLPPLIFFFFPNIIASVRIYPESVAVSL